MTTQEMCTQIVKCVGSVRTEEMYSDFTVVIGDESIKCHRLILAGCSDFFQALFRSRLREVAENSVVLHDISSEVFQMILDTIYKLNFNGKLSI